MRTPRYFECVEGGAEKFWEIHVRDGAWVVIRFGRIGTAGQTREKSFPSADAATDEVKRLIDEKRERGYVERHLGVAPPSAPKRSAMAGATAPVTLPVEVKRRAAALPRDLADGESIEVKGSGASSYVLKNEGGVYSCTCPGWRNQTAGAASRTCKHLRALRGDTAEAQRIGGDTLPVDVRRPPRR